MQEARAVKYCGRAPGIERGLQQGERAEHVGLQERFRIGDGAVDVGLGCEMRHAGEPMLVEQAMHQRGVADVAFHELDAVTFDQRLEASDVGRIGHGVDDDQPVRRLRCAPRVHQVLPDKARAAGD